MHYKTSKYTSSFFSGNLDDKAKPMIPLIPMISVFQNYIRNIKKKT